MIRKAVLADMDQINDMFDEYFQYEKKHEANTIFQRGIFPTYSSLEALVKRDILYVYEEDGRIGGCIVLTTQQPPEFATIPWHTQASDDEVFVVDLYLTRPGLFRRGIARAMIGHGADLARAKGCKVLRTECGSQNLPAVLLIKHLGFERVAIASIKAGGLMPADGHIFFEKVL